MVYRSPRQVVKRVRSWQALFLLCGLLLVVLEITFSAQGGICRSEGCKAVAASPFTHLYGIPLPWLGAAFFLAALFLLPTRRPFALLLCLGVGAALYFVFLQVVVLRTLCQFCLTVEGLIFASFLVGLLSRETRRALLRSTLAVLIGFLGVHTAYTLPLSRGGTEVCPLGGERVVLWKGPGTERAQFFFDPLCPPCGKAFEALEAHREDFAQVIFRCVAVRPGSEPLALAFYSLVLKGASPWEAFKAVHGKAAEGKASGSPEAREMLEQSQALLEELGLDAVPTLLVMGREGRILLGRGEIEDYLLGGTALPTLEVAPEVCDPSGC